jgi:hypothetical protein
VRGIGGRRFGRIAGVLLELLLQFRVLLPQLLVLLSQFVVLGPQLLKTVLDRLDFLLEAVDLLLPGAEDRPQGRLDGEGKEFPERFGDWRFVGHHAAPRIEEPSHRSDSAPGVNYPEERLPASPNPPDGPKDTLLLFSL